MRFIEFQKALTGFPVFSYTDIRKIDPDFDRRRLVEWQLKEYIQKIRSGYYCFKGNDISEGYHIYISNRIYKPSYLSLETILSYYNLIPEGVFLYTAISTRKTNLFETPMGNFEYRSVKKELFFGYRLIQMGRYQIRIAEPEKAVLDMIHFKRMNTVHDLESFRFNIMEARDCIDPGRLTAYSKVYDSEKMEKQIQRIQEYIW